MRALPDHVQRALLDLVVDPPQVLADDPDGDQLDAAEQQHHEQDGGDAGHELARDLEADRDRDRQERDYREEEPSTVAACSGTWENDEIASSEKRSMRRGVYLVSPA